MKKTFQIISTNILIIFLLFLISEIVVRISFKNISIQGIDTNLVASQAIYNSIGLKPLEKGMCNGEIIEVDKWGFRKNSHAVDTTRKSILLLGDSVTMGVGVKADSTFAGILQNLYRKKNILNPAIIGHSVADYLNQVKYYVINKDGPTNFKINEVIMFYCLNDLAYGIEDIKQPGGKLRSSLGGIMAFFRSHSKLYMFLKNAISDRSKFYFLYNEKFYRRNNQYFKQAMNDILKIHKQLFSLNIRFTVVILPYEYQLRNFYDNEYHQQDLIKEFFNKNNIHYYDSMKYLKKQTKNPKTLYLYADGIHFSNMGHKLIAEFTYSSILKKDLPK